MVKIYLFIIKIFCISLLFHRKTYLSSSHLANMLVSSSSDKHALVLTTAVVTSTQKAILVPLGYEASHPPHLFSCSDDNILCGI